MGRRIGAAARTVGWAGWNGKGTIVTQLLPFPDSPEFRPRSGAGAHDRYARKVQTEGHPDFPRGVPDFAGSGLAPEEAGLDVGG